MLTKLRNTCLVRRNKDNGIEVVKMHNCRRQALKIGSSLHRTTIPFLLTALLMITLSSCKSPQQKLTSSSENSELSKTILIPKWYAELPVFDGCRFGYGYSGIYLDQERQKNALLKNSAANMAKNDKVFIEAGWAGSQFNSQGLNASYVIEKGWQERASVLEKHLKIVREFRMENSVIALCAFCKEASLLQNLIDQIDDNLINIYSDEPPDWVKVPKSHPDYEYGIGTASSRIKPGKAWEEAERQARAALSFNLSANHNILLKTISENSVSSSQKLIETKAEIALAGIAIIRHAYSHADQSYYALAQMPTGAGRVNTGN